MDDAAYIFTRDTLERPVPASGIMGCKLDFKFDRTAAGEVQGASASVEGEKRRCKGGILVYFLARFLCNVCSLMNKLTTVATLASARPAINAPLRACMYESNTSALCQPFGR